MVLATQQKRSNVQVGWEFDHHMVSLVLPRLLLGLVSRKALAHSLKTETWGFHGLLICSSPLKVPGQRTEEALSWTSGNPPCANSLLCTCSWGPL